MSTTRSQLAVSTTRSRAERLSLAEAGVVLIDCDHRTPPAASDGFPYVAIPQMKEGRIVLDGVRRISESDFKEWTKKALPQPFDVVLSRRCNSGETAHVPPDFPFALGQNLVLLRATSDRVFPPFLRWIVRGPEWWEQINKFLNVGAVFDSLRCADVPKFTLTFPSAPEQRQIAEVLDSLDNKIELNRRMNQTLEALAAAIFKAWFIDFEPVKAKAAGAKSFPSMPQPVFDALPSSLVPAPNSPSGEIPKGWSGGSLGEVVEQIRDAIEPGDASPELRYIGLEHMPRGSICLDQNGASEDVSSLKMRFSNGDILFGKLRPYFKKVGIPGFAGICSSDIIVARPKDKRDLAFAIGHLSSQEFIDYCDRCSNGAKMPRVNWSDMARYEVVVAPEPVMAAATELFLPLIQQIHANIEESATLAALRDLLLPKLLSGEVRVSAEGKDAHA